MEYFLLPSKQTVTGSNPVAITSSTKPRPKGRGFFVSRKPEAKLQRLKWNKNNNGASRGFEFAGVHRPRKLNPVAIT